MDKGYILSKSFVDLIRKLIREVAPASSQAGSPVVRPSLVRQTFQASITGNSGTVGTPFHYAWSEMCEDGTGGLMVKPDGRTGTTTANFATNEAETNPLNYTAPIANGTIVRMLPSFDPAGNPYWRFNLFQLPSLGQYQSWNGTITGGATVVTVNPDYTRCS